MPPKKAAAKGAVKTEGVLTNGIMEESCTLPLWDDNEINSENWGGDLSIQQVDQSAQFVDNEFVSGLESCFGGVIHGWKRPTGIFSPFKPMVFRPQSQVLQFGNPYTFNVNTIDREMVEEGDERIETQAQVIALYRRMRLIVVPNAESGASSSTSPSLSPPSLGLGTPGTADSDTSPSRRRVRRRQYRGDPTFMRAFNSALLVLAQNQTVVPQGRYAWELIHPQAPTTGFPVYNGWGKYAVKLFFRGAYRKIIVDDRLPVDSNSDSILSVTDQKEIWPALILKAMLKALGPQHERRVLEDPIFILSCLLGGSVAERIPTAMKEIRLADVVRMHAANPNKWVLAVTVKAARAAQLGLEPNQLYNVMETRQYQSMLALRLCGLGAQWKGKFAYNSASWTAEVEDTLRFDPNLHRNKLELAKQWNDFWVPWEDFIEEFQFAYFMHPVAQDLTNYGLFKQLTIQEPAALNPIPPAKPLRDAPRLSAAQQALALAQANAANSIPAADPNVSTVKWLSFKPRTDCITEMVMVLLGLGRPNTTANGGMSAALMSTTGGSLGIAATSVRGNNGAAAPVVFLSGTGPEGQPSYDQTPFSIQVDRYRWAASGPFSKIISYTGPWDAYNTIPFVIPQANTEGHLGNGGATGNSSVQSSSAANLSGTASGASAIENILFRVTVKGMPPDTAISFMGATEFTLGDEKDILKEMGIFTVTDAGKYAAHEPDVETIWFKRWFQVKTPTVANFVLKTVPRHIDVTPFKMALTDSTVTKTKGGAVKGGSAGAGAGKGGNSPSHANSMGRGGNNASGQFGDSPHPPSLPQSPMPMEEEKVELSVIEDASICLLNLDTGEPVADDHLAQILGAVLEPNKLGYVLTASASPSVARAAGQWKLRITSNAPIEGVEQRSTDEVHQRSGSYHHSTSRTIFSYNILSAELATASLQLQLHGAPPNTAFMVRIRQGDKDVIERQGVKKCFIPHLTFSPPDKSSQHMTKIMCVLEDGFASQQEAARVKAVAERFEADVAAQSEKASNLREEILDHYIENGELPPSGEGGPTSAATPTKGVAFSLPTVAGGGGTSPASGALKGHSIDDRSNAGTPPLSSLAAFAMTSSAQLKESAAELPTTLNTIDDTFGLTFFVKIHASSARLDIQEDTTAVDAINAAKAAWAKRDLPEGYVPPKPTKANAKNPAASLDETSQRAVKAKEARLRFLSNPTNVFIPFAVQPPPPLQPPASSTEVVPLPQPQGPIVYTDATSIIPTPIHPMLCGLAVPPTSNAGATAGSGGAAAAAAAAAAAQAYDNATNYLSNIIRNADNSITNGCFLPSPAAYRVAGCAVTSAPDAAAAKEAEEEAIKAADEEVAAAEEAEGESSARAVFRKKRSPKTIEDLVPTAVPSNSSVHKPALLAILAKVEEGLAEQTNKRKDFFMSASNVLLGAYSIKPQTTDTEDDKSKKKKR